MAKCKACPCGHKQRIVSQCVSDIAKSDNKCTGNCVDVCVNPICGTPKVLSIMAPLIYDEVGVNLCSPLQLATALATNYPTATSATARVIDMSLAAGSGNLSVTPIAGRPNCYRVAVSGLDVRVAINIYDSSCSVIATEIATINYLPPEDADNANPETNPESIELEIYAPYGTAYNAATGTPVPTANQINFNVNNNYITQGINYFAMAKVLDLDKGTNTIVVGLTLIFQSLYFAGYRIPSLGKIKTPKGSVLTPEDTECKKFVDGDLLDLAIKPLELGPPCYEEELKDKNDNSCTC